MGKQRAKSHEWTADTFLATDQHEFGDAWRYELIDGQIVAHAAPSPDHGAMLMGLATALGNRLRGNREGCRPEAGSGAAPRNQQGPTARIPDAMVRCQDLPRIVFEIVSPSELRNRRARDRKRRDLQDIEGVMEIVELYQADVAAHVYRRAGDVWTFETIEGMDAMLDLRSIGVQIPLSEIYEFVGEPDDT
jgi:Uma2 family endonuclease